MYFYRGHVQALLLAVLVLYVGLFPKHWLSPGPLDTLGDIFGILSLALGATLRVWAVSHSGRHTRSRTIKAPSLVMSGPYSCIRNPIYVGNFLLGLGLIVVGEAFVLIPAFLIIFGLLYRGIVEQEENYLRGKFGEDFERYCSTVPRWLPRLKYTTRSLRFGSNFPLQEFGTTFGAFFGAFCLEWLESAPHDAWVARLCQWVLGN